MYYKPIARLLILLTPLFVTPDAYSHGAPTKSCQTLYPGHGVDKQYGQAPYEIRASLGANGIVLVTIESKGLPFTGFMLQGRQATDRESLINGRFSEDKNTQARNCNNDNPNTLTHRSGGSKYKVESSWTPPRGFVGGLIFRATIVQTKNVFWTAQDSQAIHISAPVVIQHKPSLAYNRQGEPAESKQTSPGAAPPKGGDNLHASSVPHGQSSVAELGGHSRIPYDVCDRRFCIGLPANCVQYRTCNMLLSGGYVSRGDGMVEFEVYADVNKYNGNSYYSVGLSTDNKMGDDSVTDCMVSDGRPLIRNSVNIGRSNEYLSQNEYHSVTPLNTTYANGVLYCKWRRRRRSTIRGQQYDIKDRKYYVLLAFGLLGQNEDKEFHTERLASDRAVDIRQIGHVHTQSSAFLIRIHGTFMIVAWLGCVSIAIFMARYFKQSWQDETVFGVQIWFAVHRSLMLASMILILIGSISIWIYVGTFNVGPHQLFGLAAVVISVLNPISAAIRPKADSSKRWIFNWFHFLVGNAGHVCAITALFLAYNITVNQLSPIYLWILIIYLVFHITSHLLMQIYTCDCTRNSKTHDISLQDVPHIKSSHSMESMTKHSFLQFYLFLYIICVVILIIGLIVCVFIPQSAVNTVKQ